MCGIGGIATDSSAEPEAAALVRMADAMRERGPDDHGSFSAPGIGLVHRRLSIIDLSERGRCPMSDPGGRVQVVHNGEIYNFAELRRELKGYGHVFTSRCDTEVIVHGYIQWGPRVVERLDGMFAFAVWDAAARTLFLARDRFGEKPLYCRELSDGVAFASTLSALHAFFDGDLAVDPAAIECFLSHSVIPGPHTIWRDVRPLPPAHRALWKAGSPLQIERYWDFPRRERRRWSVPEAEELVTQELERSVRARLIADVPVGGFLSGGVDSSLVMALAARHAHSIDTFSIGFQEAEFSELGFARQAAQAIGSTHHELVLSEDDLLRVVPDLVWQYGQPFGDSSSIATHLVSRFARERVKVSLSGDGGDESFAGYWRVAASSWASRYGAAIPESLRSRAVPAICAQLSRSGAPGLAARFEAMNRLSLAPPGKGYTNSLSWLDHRDDLFGEALRKDLSRVRPEHRPAECWVGRPLLDPDATVIQQILYDDFQVQLADDFLVKVDVASMAASLEVRPPFLDHRFVEAAWQLPDHYKLRGWTRKWLLKRIAARYVPPEIVYRKKSGFALPMKHWWRRRLIPVLRELMVDSRCAANGWIRPETVLRYLAEHEQGTRDHHVRLWLVLWLELWERIVRERSLSRQSSLA